MSGNKDIAKVGEKTRFQPGVSGNPNGRRADILNRIEREYKIDFNVRLSKADKYRLLESIMEMSLSEIQSMAKDKDCPAFMITIAQAMVGDIGKKQSNTVDKYFDRFFGKATDKMELTGKDGAELQFAPPVVNILLPADTKGDE